MTALTMDVRELSVDEIDSVSGAGRDEVYLAGAGIATAGILAGGTGVGVMVGFIGLGIMASSFFMPAD